MKTLANAIYGVTLLILAAYAVHTYAPKFLTGAPAPQQPVMLQDDVLEKIYATVEAHANEHIELEHQPMRKPKHIGSRIVDETALRRAELEMRLAQARAVNAQRDLQLVMAEQRAAARQREAIERDRAQARSSGTPADEPVESIFERSRKFTETGSTYDRMMRAGRSAAGRRIIVEH